ncbi:hypothetical protein WN944_017772 [Citrus x changshan-huyou]|uniref:Uncharacterized protein n=1 Tax=Citrus x changshan-huyou TaxID=2935761 RepID=A0AAP0MBV0_9ROSI
MFICATSCYNLAFETLKNKSTSSSVVSLTRDQIEADLSAMSLFGSKRTKKAKKRPLSVQRQLDCLFPGLRLRFITRADYKVRDTT